MSEDRMTEKGSQGSVPRPRLPRAVRYLTAIAAVAMLVALAGGLWFVYQTLDLVQRDRVRLRALEDSLRSEASLDHRLRSLEQRLGKVERSVTFASRAARVPDVIALRNWARRLDAGVQVNSDRVTGIERRMDSLSLAARSPDSLSRAE